MEETSRDTENQPYNSVIPTVISKLYTGKQISKI